MFFQGNSEFKTGTPRKTCVYTLMEALFKIVQIILMDRNNPHAHQWKFRDKIDALEYSSAIKRE